MKHSLNTDTLAYQTGMRPSLQHRDMSSMSVPGVIKSLNKYMTSGNVYKVLGSDMGLDEGIMGTPESDALTFYMLNHAVTLTRQMYHPYESMAPEHVTLWEAYHRELAVRASRMFFYLLLICTRESRHDGQYKTGAVYTGLIQKYGKKITDFHGTLKGESPGGAASKLRDHPPSATIGAYTNFMCDIFYKGSFGSSFGGPKWGAIADVLRDFVHGKITSEMMMDTAFTLAHNTGPIFNKGMLYNKSGSDLYKILDVQRSGQIPQLVYHHNLTGITQRVKNLHFECKKMFPDEFSGAVDWFKVEALGSLHKYPTEKATQSQTEKTKMKIHGMDFAKQSVIDKIKEMDAKAEAEGNEVMEMIDKFGNSSFKKSLSKTYHYSLGKVEVYPGEYVTKVKAKR